jgi:hypothetical protein
MNTTAPGSKIALTAMYDECGKVAGCHSDEQAWACSFCGWEQCPMKGKYAEVPE